MKKMNKTTETTPKATTFICSTLLNDLLCDEENTRFDLVWDSRKCRESSFAQNPYRNYSIEYRLSMVNTLIMDYHLHHYENVSTDDDGYYTFIVDDNPQESEAVLMQAKEIIELTMESIFMSGSPVNLFYAELAVSLLYKIYKELEYFNKYFKAKKELKHLLKRSVRI
jgi:hypothetical protein